MFSTKEKLDSDKEVLTVTVELDKLKVLDPPKKVTTSDVLHRIKEKYVVIGFLEKNTLIASYEEKVKATWSFKVKTSKSVKPTSKKSKINEPGFKSEQSGTAD
jgi:hypothetical protein